jgi:Domain of unknown function (DUF4037)
MTRDSERLLELARGLIAACPAELGDEVAVTGSVGAGLADEHSDIELLFLVESVPEPARVREWLDGVSGTESVLTDREDSGVWGWCRLGGVEIDPYWDLLSEAVAEVDAITSGAVLEHRRLAFAHVLIHSVQLRTRGALAELVHRCAVYPAGLRRRLIEDAIRGWEIPAERIGSAVRGDVLESRAWLQHDAERILRIVFALNRRWEPPRWKWLRDYAGTLPITPAGLVDRIETALLSSEPPEASRALAELGLEALELVSEEVDCERARKGLTTRIAALDQLAATGARS